VETLEKSTLPASQRSGSHDDDLSASDEDSNVDEYVRTFPKRRVMRYAKKTVTCMRPLINNNDTKKLASSHKLLGLLKTVLDFELGTVLLFVPFYFHLFMFVGVLRGLGEKLVLERAALSSIQQLHLSNNNKAAFRKSDEKLTKSIRSDTRDLLPQRDAS
jgi:hypothetical protein